MAGCPCFGKVMMKQGRAASLVSFFISNNLTDKCSGESLRHDFNQTWAKFKIKDVDHPLYGEHLLKALSMYNSQHLEIEFLFHQLYFV